MIYVTFVMPLKGLEGDIEKVPKLIPVMSITSVFLPIFLIVSIWPIWGFWSIPYIFIMTFGFIFSVTFLPNGHCGTIVFWTLTIAVGTLSHTLPHADHEHAW